MKTPIRSDTFSKFAAWCNFTKTITPPWVFLPFSNCTNGTKSPEASHIDVINVFYISKSICSQLFKRIYFFLGVSKCLFSGSLIAVVYLQPCKTSMIEFFGKNSWRLSAAKLFSQKGSVLNFWDINSKYVSPTSELEDVSCLKRYALVILKRNQDYTVDQILVQFF